MKNKQSKKKEKKAVKIEVKGDTATKEKKDNTKRGKLLGDPYVEF